MALLPWYYTVSMGSELYSICLPSRGIVFLAIHLRTVERTGFHNIRTKTVLAPLGIQLVTLEQCKTRTLCYPNVNV